MQSDAPNKLNITDEVLVKKSQQGDSKAMEMLIAKYQNRIFNVIMKICRNRDDAMELTQDTFVKFIEKINTFEGKSSFYTWLYRIGVNMTLNYCKRKVKFKHTSLELQMGDSTTDGVQELKAFLTDEKSIDPMELSLQKEIYDIAMLSLESIDPDHRVIVVLRDIEGLSYNEISEVLDLELGTVKSRLFRARQNLKAIIQVAIS